MQTEEENRAAFFAALEQARAGVKGYLAKLEAGAKDIPSHERQLLGFLEDFDRVEIEVRTGVFPVRHHEGDRSLASLRAVIDCWPYPDPVGLLIGDLNFAYEKIAPPVVPPEVKPTRKEDPFGPLQIVVAVTLFAFVAWLLSFVPTMPR